MDIGSVIMNLLVLVLLPIVLVMTMIFSIRNYNKYKNNKDKFDGALDQKLKKGEITEEEYYRMKNRMK